MGWREDFEAMKKDELWFADPKWKDVNALMRFAELLGGELSRALDWLSETDADRYIDKLWQQAKAEAGKSDG